MKAALPVRPMRLPMRRPAHRLPRWVFRALSVRVRDPAPVPRLARAWWTAAEI